MPKERWKVIDGHPNYAVSNLGNVRNLITERTLTPYDDGTGYMRVKLDGNCLRLHILVAKAFIPNPDGKLTVNHIHGNKKDNRASQLEWATFSEQMSHAWRTGLRSRPKENYGKKKVI
ncbi:MAG: NUMOD4 motif-containing HNH endonuclease [Firmicutes bacterium]|nr:NUMOD4 motif-containing HNH endonuclease [Bacillota bacterium]